MPQGAPQGYDSLDSSVARASVCPCITVVSGWLAWHAWLQIEGRLTEIGKASGIYATEACWGQTPTPDVP